MIRPYKEDDFKEILEIIIDAAQAYRGVIPSDCWHEPYMTHKELHEAVQSAVNFSVFEDNGQMKGVMGIQDVLDVTLIRHAYVRTAFRNQGIGGELLSFLMQRAKRPVLIGTWAAARWAIRFYEKHGFRLIDSVAEKDNLLQKYWKIPQRQVHSSVVLADEKWINIKRGRGDVKVCG